MKENLLYFDNAATTPLFKELKDSAINILDEYVNPSGQYTSSKLLKQKIEDIRTDIAQFIGAEHNTIYFTSGATESNNTVIKGFLEKNDKEKYHILSTEVEHPSVLEPLKYLEMKKKISLSLLSGDKINIEEFENKLTEKTKFSSVMHANNETGDIFPVLEISKLCLNKNIFIHSDLTQIIGKKIIDVKKIGLDAASFSGHKLHSIKGVGILYLKNKDSIIPIMHGGAQEYNIRSGTENIPGILFLGLCVKKHIQNQQNILRNYKNCSDLLINLLNKTNINYEINSTCLEKTNNIFNLFFKNIKGELLMALLDNKFKTQISIGSACSSNKDEKNISSVLRSMNFSEERIRQSVRISFGVNTTENEIKLLINQIVDIFNQLQVEKKIYNFV